MSLVLFNPGWSYTKDISYSSKKIIIRSNKKNCFPQRFLLCSILEQFSTCYFSVHCEALPIKRKFARSNRNVWPSLSRIHRRFIHQMLWNSVPFLDKSFSKAFAISEEDSMCLKAMICSTEKCFFFIYLSNIKADHSGKTMSSGVRKIKRHKLCMRSFTIFFYQKFNTKIAVIYRPKKEMHHKFWKRA